jgi:hypothetical protein
MVGLFMLRPAYFLSGRRIVADDILLGKEKLAFPGDSLIL